MTDEELTTERASPARTRRWAAMLGGALVVATTVVVILFGRSHPAPVVRDGCFLDAKRGPNGQLYWRDRHQDCKFVDEHGNMLPDH